MANDADECRRRDAHDHPSRAERSLLPGANRPVTGLTARSGMPPGGGPKTRSPTREQTPLNQFLRNFKAVFVIAARAGRRPQEVPSCHGCRSYVSVYKFSLFIFL